MTIPFQRLLSVLGIFAVAAAMPALHAQSTVFWLSGSGGGSGTWDTTYASWSAALNTQTLSVWTNGSNATFANTAGTVNINGSVTAKNLTFSTSGYTIGPGTLTLASGSTIDSSTGTAAISAVIADSGGGFTKTNTGTLTLSGSSTYTGATIISAGTVSINTIASVGGGASALGAPTTIATGSISLGSGTSAAGLTYTGVSKSTDRVINLAGTTGGATLTNNGTGALTFTSNFTATGNGAKTLTLAGTNTAGSIISGVIPDSSAATTVAVSGGKWILAGSNTYTGTTTISGGTLQFAKQTSLYNNTPASWTAANFGVGSGATAAFNVGGTGEFTTANIATLAALGGASTGFTNGSTLSLDTTNAGGSFIHSSTIADPNGGANVLALAKLGTGTLILSANNSFTGTSTISAGTLQLGNGGTSGSVAGNIVLSSSAFSTLALNRSDTLTLAGNITGTGTVSIASGTLQLTGSNQISSTNGGGFGLTVNLANAVGATLDVTGTQKIAGLSGGGTTGGNIVLQPGSTLQTLGYANFQSSSYGASFAGNITGTGNFLLNGTNQNGGVFTSVSQTLTGTNTFVGTVTVSGANNSLNIGNGGTGGSLVADLVLGSGGTVTFNRSDASTYGGVVSGSAGSFVKSGAGTLTVMGASTFTGTTTISAGTLQIGAGSTTGGWAGSIVDNATLAFNRSDALTHTGGISGTGSVIQSSDASLTLSGALSGSLNVKQTGTGTLTLSGSNSFTGGATLSAGTLALGSSTALGASGTVNFGGGTLQYGSGVSTDYSSRFSTAASQSYKVDTNGQSVTFASALTSSGGTLTKSGTGTLTLSGANTYSGGTSVTAGTLALGTATTLQNGTVNLSSSGTLGFGTLGAATLGGLSGSSGFALTNTNAAAVTLSIGNNNADTSYSGAFSGSGGITKVGTGTLTLSGTNSQTGTTTLSAGTLAVSGSSALGTGLIALNGGSLQAASASTISNPISLNANSTINGSQSLNLAGPVTLNGFNALSVTATAPATISVAIGESTPSIFIKQGSGELQLTGASTYTGGTFIQAGTLRINNTTGSAFGTGAVTVASGATLAGAGSFTGALQLNGTFAPGNSPGTTSTGSQTWAGGGAYVWEINNGTGVSGTNWDLLSISGALTINATSGSPFTVNLTSLLADNSPGNVINFNTATNHSYTIATASSGITGFSASDFTLDTAGFTNALNGGAWTIAQSGNNLNLNFTASAIPEPSTYAALLGACALALACRKRRRRA
jgi:fibronectin-binding autotransporter adhesin